MDGISSVVRVHATWIYAQLLLRALRAIRCANVRFGFRLRSRQSLPE